MKNRLRADTFERQELGRRLADALREHHQLAGSGHLVGRRILLHLERRDGFGDVEQIPGLAVDLAQRGSDFGQDFLLRHDGGGVLLGAIDQGRDGVEFILVLRVDRVQSQVRIAGFEALDGLAQHAGAVSHIRKGLDATHKRLRDRLRQPLGLHQRLPGRTHLLADATRHAERECRHHPEQDQHHSQTDQQYLLVFGDRPGAQNRQRDVVARWLVQRRRFGPGLRLRLWRNLLHHGCSRILAAIAVARADP